MGAITLTSGRWHGPDGTLHAGAQIYGMIQSQARTLAYVDAIWILVDLTGRLIPLPFVMNRPQKTPESKWPTSMHPGREIIRDLLLPKKIHDLLGKSLINISP